MSKRCPNCNGSNVAKILYGYMEIAGEVKRALRFDSQLANSPHAAA